MKRIANISVGSRRHCILIIFPEPGDLYHIATVINLRCVFCQSLPLQKKKELGTSGYLHYLKIKIIVKEISWGGRGSLAKAPLIAKSMDGFSASYK